MHCLGNTWRDWRRQNLLKSLGPGPLRRYFAAPFPSPRTPCDNTELVAIDLETTGLNPKQDRILSVGTVIVTGTTIQLDSATYHLVRPNQSIPETSAVIHGITDDCAAAGWPIGDVMGQILERLRGRVLLAHHARIEYGFLDQASRRLCGGPLLVPTIDTQILARRSLRHYADSLRPGDLRLHALRRRYGLPQYPAHNALCDALAAAELYLALLYYGGNPAKRRLREVLTS